ncbi:MAG: hypothetical protein GSR82_00920 [Desulfurococcales archaeon]|nr:hypothetical protein [Desulfurococcales archaeon]
MERRGFGEDHVFTARRSDPGLREGRGLHIAHKRSNTVDWDKALRANINKQQYCTGLIDQPCEK